MIEACLEDLEQRIDPAAEEALFEEWKAFSEGEFRGDIFTPARPAARPARVEWPWASTNATLDAYEKMALSQLGSCSAQYPPRRL